MSKNLNNEFLGNKSKAKRIIVGVAGTVAGALILVGCGDNMISKPIPHKMQNNIASSSSEENEEERPIDLSPVLYEEYLAHKEKINTLDTMNDEEKKKYALETIILQCRILKEKIAYALCIDEKNISIFANDKTTEIVIIGKNPNDRKNFKHNSRTNQLSKEIQKYLEAIQDINRGLLNIDNVNFKNSLDLTDQMVNSRIIVSPEDKKTSIRMVTGQKKTQNSSVYDYPEER